jgi:hypothetical protein
MRFIIIGAGIWPCGQSGGLARRRSRFDPRQGRPLYIWMYTPAFWVCFGGYIALYKNPQLFYFICLSWTVLSMSKVAHGSCLRCIYQCFSGAMGECLRWVGWHLATTFDPMGRAYHGRCLGTASVRQLPLLHLSVLFRSGREKKM